MDLNYKASGTNTNRLRLFNQILGTNAEMSALDDVTQSVFSIWCGDNMPGKDYKVWWKNTGHDSIEKIVEQAKKDMLDNSCLDIIVAEHKGEFADNLFWIVAISRDNIVRTFQNDIDVCLYLKELIAKH